LLLLLLLLGADDSNSGDWRRVALHTPTPKSDEAHTTSGGKLIPEAPDTQRANNPQL